MKKKIIAILLTLALVVSAFTGLQTTAVSDYTTGSWIYDSNYITLNQNNEGGFNISSTSGWVVPHLFLLKGHGPKFGDISFKASWSENQYLYIGYQPKQSNLMAEDYEGIKLIIWKLSNNSVKVQRKISNSEYVDITGVISYDFSKEHTYGFTEIGGKWHFRLDDKVYTDYDITDGINYIYNTMETLNSQSPHLSFTASSVYTIENLQFINNEMYSVTTTFNAKDKYGISWHSNGKQFKPQVQFGLSKDASLLACPEVADWTLNGNIAVSGNGEQGFKLNAAAYNYVSIDFNNDFSTQEVSLKIPQLADNKWSYMAITSKHIDGGVLLPGADVLDGLYLLFVRSYSDLTIQLWNGATVNVLPKLVNFDYSSEHTIGFEKIADKWYMSFDGVTYTEDKGGADLTSYLSGLVGKTNWYTFTAADDSQNYEFDVVRFVPNDIDNYMRTVDAFSDYAETDGYCELGKDYIYKATIGNLKAGATYYYRLGDALRNNWTEWRTFKVQEGDDSAFTFLYFADTHVGGDASSNGELWPVAMKAASEKYNDYRFILQAGDLVDVGWSEELLYSQYKTAFSNENGGIGNYLANTVFAPVTGNHEKWNYESFNHYNVSLPEGQDTSKGIYYSYDYNDAHFVMLNMNDTKIDDTTPEGAPSNVALSDAQMQWLRDDLSKNTKSWTIVGIHASTFGNGDMIFQSDVIGIKTRLLKVLDEYDVDLVLSGHDHSFARTYPMYGRSQYSEHWNHEAVREGYRFNSQYAGDDIVLDVNPNGTVFLENGSIAVNKPDERLEYAAYQDKHGVPQDATYTAITVDGDKLVVKTYTVKEDGTTELYDSYGIVRDNNVDINNDQDIDICDLVAMSEKEEYDGKAVDITTLTKKLLTFFKR